MARSRSRSPARARRHHGSSSSSRRDRISSSSRRRSRSRSPRRSDPPASSDDKNGEIALSIDETNRLRLSLGLKPLALAPSKSEQNVVSLQKTSAQVDAERAQQVLQTKLQQSKTRRELTQKLVGQSLGEQLKAQLKDPKVGATTPHDALEWVKQSRKHSQAAKTTRSAPHDPYEATALAGMMVGHASDHIEDGTDVILTLKDQFVLNDGKDLNEDADVLVNVALSEKERREARAKRAKRAALPIYCGYDDDEFLEGARGKQKKQAKLLAHYDEDDEAMAAARAHTFQLDARGESNGGKKAGRVEEEADVISLATTRPKRVTEYYTQEEVDAQFAKRKKRQQGRKKKTLRRQKHGGEDEVEVQLTPGVDADQEAREVVTRLEVEARQTDGLGAKDRGTRLPKGSQDEADEEAKLRRFQDAREKANRAASQALAAHRPMKRRRIDESDLMDDAMAMERELSASVARARQLTQQKLTPGSLTSEDRIAQLIRETVRDDDESTPIQSSADVTLSLPAKTSIGHVFGDVDTTANTVVFNEATDFETRLRDAMAKRAAQFQAAAANPSVDSTVRPLNHQVAGGDEQKEKVEDEKKNEDGEAIEKEGWGDEEPLVGTGMGATLALLRKTGDLRQTRVERQAGRTNDARDRDFEDDLRIKNGVKLDYRDEFGRLLTKKEAFRMLSYKFHGHEPGKKKKEKRLRQLKEELEAQKLVSGEGSTKIMKVLEKKQQHTKEAHVVLSSGV